MQLQQKNPVNIKKNTDKASTGKSLIHQLVQMMDFFRSTRHEYKISYNKPRRDS